RGRARRLEARPIAPFPFAARQPGHENYVDACIFIEMPLDEGPQLDLMGLNGNDTCLFPRHGRSFWRRSSLQEPAWRASAGSSFPICRIMSPSAAGSPT